VGYVSHKPIQERVTAAGLSLITLERGNFYGEDDWQLFTSIMDRLEAREDRERGRIEASAAAMNDEIAENVARDIAGLLGAHTLSYFVARQGR
jgi:hypothetical protein